MTNTALDVSVELDDIASHRSILVIEAVIRGLDVKKEGSEQVRRRVANRVADVWRPTRSYLVVCDEDRRQHSRPLRDVIAGRSTFLRRGILHEPASNVSSTEKTHADVSPRAFGPCQGAE